MPKKGLSIFLLVLFSLVILFPGYSQNMRRKKDARVLVLEHARHIANLESMFKKCLSCGIANNGPVNEEAPSSSGSEERADDGESPIDEFALADSSVHFDLQSVVLYFVYKQSIFPLTVADIATPPPDCSFS